MIAAIISVDDTFIKEKLGDLAYKSDVVMRRSANRALTTAGKTIKRETAKLYRVFQKDVGKTLTNHQAGKTELYAKIVSNGYHANLAKYKVSPLRQVRRTKRGGYTPSVYKASVERGGALKRLNGKPKPFVATMKSGHTGVFVRKSKKRLPIEAVQGPAVPQIIKNEKVMLVLEKEVSEMMLKRIEHEVGRMLAK